MRWFSGEEGVSCSGFRRGSVWGCSGFRREEGMSWFPLPQEGRRDRLVFLTSGEEKERFDHSRFSAWRRRDGLVAKS